MDSSRSQDPRVYRGAGQGVTYPYGNGQQPPQKPAQQPRRTSSSIYPYEQAQPSQSTYPYEQRQPVPQPDPRQQPQARRPQQGRAASAAKAGSVPRRLLGVLAFFVLTGLSMPIHIAAVFFIYVEFESPGDAATAVLLVSASFVGSFLALLVTGIVSQLVGAFPGRWRARVTFAVLSGIIALGSAYVAALVVF